MSLTICQTTASTSVTYLNTTSTSTATTATANDHADVSRTVITTWHPIRKLAVELLGEIFLHCLPFPPKPIESTDAPLTLLQVCRLWRQTAQGTPRLWTDIDMGEGFKLNPVTIFRLWLDHAGALPLKVTLPLYDLRHVTRSEQVINILLDNFHRLEELEGHLTPWFANYLLRRRKSLPIRAPHLKSLNVRGWDKVQSPRDIKFLRRCIIAPKLETCDLNTMRLQMTLLSLEPSCVRTLRGLWVVEVAEYESMDQLASFTNLENLGIFLHAASNSTPLHIPSEISIPSLKRLHIGTFPDYDPSLFLKALQVPFIDHLEVYSTVKGQTSLAPLLEALMSGYTPPLRFLSLSGYTLCAPEYLPWISRFTKLETLEIINGTIDKEMLQSLSLDPSSPPTSWVCPHLSSLVFKRLHLPWDDAVEMVRSRLPTAQDPRVSGQTLRRVVFDGCGEMEKRHREAFSEMQKNSGGQVEIKILGGLTMRMLSMRPISRD